MKHSNARWIVFAWCAAAVLLFFIENRAAYKGYFSADDLNNLSWPTFVGNDVYLKALVSPRFDPYDFRPVAFLYYRYLGRKFNLQYAPYVAAIQLLHALNVLLLYLVVRRLGVSKLAAGVAGVFYAFSAVTMEAYWKPMYVFDVLCCTLCLATLLLYLRGWWIAGLITFWLAYKSKELAVMLPIALFAWEMLLGKRNWKRLVPYLAISLSFGVQAVWRTPAVAEGSGYHLKFTPDILWRSVSFYSSALFFVPFAALALLALPFFIRDRRLYLGLVFTAAMFLPLLALRERLETVYWYVPLIGVAIIVAVVAARVPVWAIAMFLAIWLPLNYAGIREKRRAILAEGDENRWYIDGLRQYARRVPPLKAVVYENRPAHLDFGTEPAIQRVFGWNVHVAWYLSPGAKELMAEAPMAVITYSAVTHTVKGTLRPRNELQSYISFSERAPQEQLISGWSIDMGDMARIAGRGEAMLYRPADAKDFELVAGAQPNTTCRITVIEDGHSLGTDTLEGSAGSSLRWRLGAAAAGDKRIAIEVEAVGKPEPHAGAIRVKSLGYVAVSEPRP